MTDVTHDRTPTAVLPDPAATTTDRPRGWKRWALPAGALVLGLVLGTAAGGDPTRSEEYQALKAELVAAEDEVRAAEGRASDAEAEASVAEGRATAAEATARQLQAATSTSAAPTPSAPSPASSTTTGTTQGVDFSMPAVVGMDLQTAQNTIQTFGVFFSTSHDLLGSRQQVLDSNWTVCTQNIPAGQRVTGDAEGTIDLGVVKRGESCP